MSWEFKGRTITNTKQLPEGAHGFIYLLTFSDGKQYIGRKNLYSVQKKPLGKKELATRTDQRLKKYKVVVKESDWINYTSSNKYVNESMKEGSLEIVKREIIKISFTAKQTTYYETQALFCYGVLEYPENYYNDNILGKFFKKDLSDSEVLTGEDENI